MSKLSIISVDYEYHVPRSNNLQGFSVSHGMQKGAMSVASQGFDNYEWIICHDGPKEVPYEEELDFNHLPIKPIIISTPERMNDWGHSSRDLAMRQATGDYFIQHNIDNFFYPNAFQKISDALDKTDKQILIFNILHFKSAFKLEYDGIPPVFKNIDLMQAVISKRVWENVGYWYNKERDSDGYIYEELCKTYEYAHLNEVLAENY